MLGNGPSAITLSYFLSGRWPYYSSNDSFQHPLDFLHYRLVSESDKSLLVQDLKYLSEVYWHTNLNHWAVVWPNSLIWSHQGLEGRSTNPVALLFDTLNHPEADIGLNLPSLLSWKSHPEHAIDHVVLGRGPPGGSWQVDLEKRLIFSDSTTWFRSLTLNKK